MLALTAVEWACALAAMTLGAWVQGAVGFGSALVAAPLLALIDPQLVPEPLILCGLLVTLWVAYRERAEVNLPAVGWVLAGRAPGTGLGVFILGALAETTLSLLFATMLLAAVAMLAFGCAPRRNRGTLFASGLVAGVMGVVTSVGGPPVALMFHDASGPSLRGTLSGYFILSSLMSLAALWLAGLLEASHVYATALLMPGIFLGLILSKHTTQYVDRGYTRPAVLCLSGASAAALLLKYV